MKAFTRTLSGSGGLRPGGGILRLRVQAQHAQLRMAIVVLTLVGLLAVALAVPTSAWAASGAVEIGIEVANTQEEAGAGGTASVDVGLAIGLDKQASGASATSVPLGLAIGYDRVVDATYTIKLDPNNGTRADAFKGSVAPARLSVAVDSKYDKACDEGTLGEYEGDKPQGISADVLAAVSAKRPGYVLDGWYWADDAKDPDQYGRAQLMSAPVDLGELADYDFVRANAGRTLYAKWKLGPRVRIDLEGAVTEGGYAKLYCWPGRGYTFAEPAIDKELEAGFVVSTIDEGGLDVTAALGVTQNPAHQLSTKVFSSWGYETQGSSGALQQEKLITCEKNGTTGGTTGTTRFAYRLMPAALAYATDEIETWRNISSPEEDPAAPAGSRRAMWSALYDTARISVAAPFRVTFQKEQPTAEGGATAVPYTADELDVATRIYSAAQPFYNRSTAGEGDAAAPVSVYVSALECMDKGAGTLFPCTTDERRVLGLGDTDTFITDAGSPRALRFGYDAFLGQNRVSATANAATWIVLPPAGDDDTPKQLYFGFDLTKVQLNRAAIMTAGASSSADAVAGYVETLANVKYTYSVAP